MRDETLSQTYQSATGALAEMASIAGETPEKSRVFVVGMASPDELDENEYFQFAYLAISLMRRYENVLFQYQTGLIDEDFWIGHRENMLWFYHQPGFQRMWQERRLGFSKALRDYVEDTSAETLSTGAVRQV